MGYIYIFLTFLIASILVYWALYGNGGIAVYKTWQVQIVFALICLSGGFINAVNVVKHFLK